MNKTIFIILLSLSSFSYSQTATDYFNNGHSKHKLGDYVGAIEEYNKAIELSPDSANIYYNRATSFYLLKLYYGAIKDCDKAIELNPDLGDAYLMRGSAKYQSNEFTGACDDWKKSYNLGLTQAGEFVVKYCK